MTQASTRRIVAQRDRESQSAPQGANGALQPRIDVRIHEGHLDGKRIIVFEVQPAPYTPVRFKDAEFIRIGSYTKKLRDHPEKERALWALFAETPFEKGGALAGVSSDEVLSLIAYPKYFELVGLPLPDNRVAILDRLKTENVICGNGGDRYEITNLGAVLFAQSLKGFERLARKALRIIIYRGDNRVETIKEWTGEKGYAVGFEGAIRSSRMPSPVGRKRMPSTCRSGRRAYVTRCNWRGWMSKKSFRNRVYL